MCKSRPAPARRLTCTDLRFVEVDFPRQLSPRLVIQFSASPSTASTPSSPTSLGAGTNNALIYILLANWRDQNLDPEDYLIEVIKRLPHDATSEQAAALTPARIAAERHARTEAEQVA